MKTYIEKGFRLCSLGVSLMLICCLAVNYSFAQCTYEPGDDALFNNTAFNAVTTVQICYLVDDATGAVVATDASGNCDFPGVAYGAYSVYAVNDCTDDGTTDIVGTPLTTLAEIMAAGANVDADVAGPSAFTVCPPSVLSVCEGTAVTVTSVPGYETTNTQTYVLVCDGLVVESTTTDPTATLTLPGIPGAGFPDCEVYAINHCSPAGDAGVAAAITVGSTWASPASADIDVTMADVTVANCPLPLELLSFETTCSGSGSVKLTWITATEVDVDYIEIERSFRPLNGFISLGKVEAVGGFDQTTYTFMDERAISSAYYRLKIVDLDGTFEYSSLRNVECLKGTFGITEVFPNPTKDELTVSFETSDRTPIDFRLTDVLGRVLMQETITPELGINRKEINLRGLSSAMYFVIMNNGTSKVTEKVIKKHY